MANLWKITKDWLQTHNKIFYILFLPNFLCIFVYILDYNIHDKLYRHLKRLLFSKFKDYNTSLKLFILIHTYIIGTKK